MKYVYLKQSIIWYLNSLFGATHKPVLQQHNTMPKLNTIHLTCQNQHLHNTQHGAYPVRLELLIIRIIIRCFCCLAQGHRYTIVFVIKSSCSIALTELAVRRFFDSKPLQTQTEHFSDELVPHVLLSSWPRPNTALNASRAWKEAGHVDFSGSGTSVWTEYAFIGTVFLKAD